MKFSEKNCKLKAVRVKTVKVAKKTDKLLKFWPKVLIENKMANFEERLTNALEQLVLLQSENRNSFQEISYISEYGGEPHRLTHFVSIVDTFLRSFEEQRRTEKWRLIYNTKIVGRAKELLLNNQVTSWDEAKVLLTQHFRPLVNTKDISRKISNIKVSSIAEFCIKIEQILGDINSFALFESNGPEIKKLLEATLVTKIKDIACGSLARELRSEHCIHSIKRILYTYVGFDENIEKTYPHPKSKPHPPHPRNSNENNGSNRFRNSNPQLFNPSGQFRNARQNPQPMEVDTIERDEANNNIEKFFLN